MLGRLMAGNKFRRRGEAEVGMNLRAVCFSLL